METAMKSTGGKRALRRITGILMVLVTLAALLAGCAPKPENIVKKAMENSQRAKSFHSAMDIKLGMGSQGITMDVDISGELDTILKPQKTKGNMSIGMMGFAVNMDMYGDETYSYVGVDGNWTRSPIDDGNGQMLDPSEMMSMYTEGIKEVTLLGEEEMEGQACYKLEVRLSGEKIKELVESNLGNALGNGETFELGVPEDVTVQMWIDKSKNRFVRMDADMSDLIQQALNDTSASLEVNISKCTMTMIVSNYDAVEDFEIPDEALNAEEARGDASALPF